MRELAVFLCLVVLSPIEGRGRQPSKIISTQQGPVRGFVRVPEHIRLSDVEAFLGLPYASPPVGYKRFMPPSNPEPRPSNAIYEAIEFKPVCPQLVPDLEDEMRALRYMSVGKLKYLKKLTPYLKNQSEDCLYLNIYKPKRDGIRFASEKFPVVVFFHGESYEWNSGNPYDGAILASYGDVVVVTINFRLGIFGFFKPTLGDHVISNFGILDQIAALQWIKENIKNFNGDPNAVTLIGHGSGASLISFLVVSPVAQASSDLFHRVILMSGSFLSPMALTPKPIDLTLQVASQLQCPLDSQPLMMCLRSKSVKELLRVKINVPMYTTPFGPNVDGIVVEDTPENMVKITKYREILSRLDIMFGLTTSEAFHQFPAPTVSYGVTSEYLETILRSFLLNIYKQNSDPILHSVLNEYTDFRLTQVNNITNRDNMFEIFSDAKIAAPTMRLAVIHSEASRHRANSYFYVFEHQTQNGYYSQAFGSLHGEEIAYGLGMPLSGGTYHLRHNYTREEQILSEIMMNYWVNFIYSGNANEFSIRTQKLLSTTDRLDSLAPSWPNFDSTTQQYMSLDLECNVKSHYRSHKLALWNDFIPTLLDPYEEEDRQSDNLQGGGGMRFPSDRSQNLPSVIVTARPTFIPKTTKRPSYVNSSGIPISVVVLVGFVFFTFNTCACVALAYQRRRIRQREDNLQKTISRLSINSEMTTNTHTDSLKSALKKGGRDSTYNSINRRPSRVLFEDEVVYEDHPNREDESYCKKRSIFPKSLPDIPAAFAGALARAKGEPDRPPSPIIEMVPVSTYEMMYPRRPDPGGNVYGITYPDYNVHGPFEEDNLNEICVCPAGNPYQDEIHSSYARVQLPANRLITPSQTLYAPLRSSSPPFNQPDVVIAPETEMNRPLHPAEMLPRMTPVLRKIGEKTPPGTLKRDTIGGEDSCKSWCAQYDQAFLSKTLEAPDIPLELLDDEEDNSSNKDVYKE